MEIETPQPPVTMHEINIKVSAVEAAGIVSWLDKALATDLGNLWSGSSMKEIQDAFQVITNR